MEKRKLGKTNMQVYPIGLGGIPIQRDNFEVALDTIQEALQNKVNFIDSARGYTISEEYIGKALEKLDKRNSVYLATKSMARTYENMKKDIMISLNNFRTEYIDLYQMHNVKNKEEFMEVISDEGAYKALVEAKEQGLIKHIGITAHSKDFLNWLLDSEYADLVETVQFPYNFIERDAEVIFAKAKKLNIGTIAMKPLGGGTIDKYETAIKYILNNDNLGIAIPGMGSREEVKINLSIEDLIISNEEYKYIEKLQEELKNDFCHRCGYCMPCTVGIDIPGTFTLERYYIRYGLIDWAKQRYFGAKVLPSRCIECKVCLKKCPYGLDIPTKLKKVVEIFEK